MSSKKKKIKLNGKYQKSQSWLAYSIILWNSFYRFNCRLFSHILDFLKYCATPKRLKGASLSKKDCSLLYLFPKMSAKIHGYIFAICDVIGFY